MSIDVKSAINANVLVSPLKPQALSNQNKTTQNSRICEMLLAFAISAKSQQIAFFVIVVFSAFVITVIPTLASANFLKASDIK